MRRCGEPSWTRERSSSAPRRSLRRRRGACRGSSANRGSGRPSDCSGRPTPSRPPRSGGATTARPQVTTEFGGPASVPLVLKADSSGSLEALRASLEHFPTERVVMQVVRAVRSVTEGDVEFAQALEATIIGFNVSTPGKVKQQAEQLKVGVHTDPCNL